MARHNTRGTNVNQKVTDSGERQRGEISQAMAGRKEGQNNVVRSVKEKAQSQQQSIRERIRAGNEASGRG